jgi:hypothetical protein
VGGSTSGPEGELNFLVITQEAAAASDVITPTASQVIEIPTATPTITPTSPRAALATPTTVAIEDTPVPVNPPAATPPTTEGFQAGTIIIILAVIIGVFGLIGVSFLRRGG